MTISSLRSELTAAREENQVRTAEVANLLEQQTATSAILRVIAASPTDIQPVLQVVAESAARFCDTYDAGIFLARDGTLFPKAHYGPIAFDFEPMPVARDWVCGRAFADCKTVHVNDIAVAGAEFPVSQTLAERLGHRTMLATPLMRDTEAIGALVIRRIEVKPFSEKQIKLLKIFADQAVIAIENVRLFDEVQARNRDVMEALEQQTATGAILRVIAASPTDIQPVLNAVAESAAQLCEAYDAAIFLRQGESLAIGAHHGPIPIDFTTFPITRDWVTGRAVIDRRPMHVHDLLALEGEFPAGRSMALRLGHRTILATPLLREDEAIGALVIRRTEVRPFSEKQVELLKTFADQAVIAIENVRLFEEVQARTRDLGEALEQQTATADVLKAISRSAFDLQPVLQTLVDSAIRLAGADMGAITLRVGDTLRFMAGGGQAAELHAYERANPHVVGRGTFQGRAALEGLTIHVADALEDPEYERPEAAIMGSFRGVLSVPLKRGQETIGVFGMARRAIGLFSPRQVELVESFADQAVIAIENVRLFDEVQARNREVTESLEQQTATAEVLKTISSSAFDLDSVLHTLVKSASDLCHSGMGYIYLRQGDVLQPTVQIGWSQEFQDHMNNLPVTPGRGSIAARVAQSGSVEQIADVLDDPEYTNIEGQRLGGFRTLLGVPLMRDGAVTGVFVLARSSVSPFSTREIELVQTFSDQAVIAIENVRLFEEVKSRNRDLAESLEQQMATGAILQVIAGSPTDIQPVLDAVAESAARLCDAYDATIYLLRSDRLAVGAHHGPIPIDSAGLPVARDIVTGRAVLDRVPVHVHDLTIAGEEFAAGRMMAQRLGFRAILATPLLQEGKAIGALMIRRIEARPFSDSQIGLLKTFANQAVIAIGNVRLFEEVQARTAELGEALQQQTATADVLKVISRSAFDLHRVLETLIDSACKLCGSHTGGIYMLDNDGDAYKLAANYGMRPELVAYEARHAIRVGRDSYVGRSALEKAVIHVPDVAKDLEYGFPELPSLGGFKAVLSVPLMREGVPIGVFSMGKPEPGPYTPRQVDLVQTFADQAVIAIENVRLFDEVQARTAELGDALQQQTATADVLKVISRSTFDLQTVLDTLTQSAAQLCEADMAGITRQEPEGAYYATNYNLPPDWLEYVKDKHFVPGRGSVVGRALLDRGIVHLADVLADPEYTFLESTSEVWFRTVLGVPLMREGNPIGVLILARQKVQPFTEKQIDLIQTFADQAVIAIENARLFEEVQARTAELSESLQQQTATADVLKAISRSTFDLRAVLDALAESVTRLCEADNASIVRETDGKFVEAASYGYPAELEEYFSGFVHVPGRGTGVGRVLLEGKAVQIPDVLADADYTLWEGQRLGGYRTVLAVPLLREGVPIGVFSLTRSTVRPFTERQIELVETFADQAVIAIENVRLFDEVQARTAELSESLQQQTATADVLKAISRSTFDLQPVLDTLAESAAKLCDADTSVIFKRDGDLYRWSADYGNLPEAAVFAKANPFAASRDSVTGRVALEARAVHVSDVLADPDYGATQLQKLGGYRTILCVPILREGAPVGVFALTRSQVRDFTPRQIELVETFADQSGIAIENVRLFDEVQARTRELSRSLEDLRTAQDRLVQTEKLASLGQLTAGIAHEIKNPLNFVNNFSALSGELIDDLSSVLAGAPLEASVRKEVAELTGMLKSNLDKVVQHGKRADSIVRNMLLHSRAGSGEHRPIDINAVVEESLNLAYHGARAEKPGFNVTLTRNFDPQAGDVDLYPQEITRVLLNLISNGFYATAKRSAAANGADYEPTLSATTRSLGDRVEIRIRDNGTGIPSEVKEKMFNPFFTTKPAGEGTGLGLSLSHDIVVKQHAGTIDVDSQPGEFTEFRIVLPRAAASLAKSGAEG
ncbi:GAF domain-containing protein [Mesorhizobium loti]|nr:GAF domain-containing protein [Mesorhizobium loti]